MSFDDALKELLGIEGGYSNDPVDRGGETLWGITKGKFHEHFPGRDLKTMTPDEMRFIYLVDFWDKISADLILSKEIAYELFEQAVNFGPYWAGYHAQRALNMLGANLATDGVMGLKTITALNEYPYPAALLKALNGFQFMRYAEITQNDPTQRRFFRGWLQRVV